MTLFTNITPTERVRNHKENSIGLLTFNKCEKVVSRKWIKHCKHDKKPFTHQFSTKFNNIYQERLSVKSRYHKRVELKGEKRRINISPYRESVTG
jgi:hypothetical protein